MGKLTNKELEAATAANLTKCIRENGGMIGKVRPAKRGEASIQWSWRYRFGNKVRQITLGTWPAIGMPAIRRERDRMAAIVAGGRDPADERKVIRLQARAEQLEEVAREQARIAEAEAKAARMTVRDLFEHWCKTDLSKRKHGGGEVRRMFEKDVFPAIGALPVEDVRRGQVAALLDKVRERGVSRMVALMLAQVRQMFRFAVARDWIEADPTTALKKADFGGKPVERDRVMNEAEIRQLTKALPAALGETQQRALWIQLATCCRIGEITGAQWGHVDFEAGTWTIPAEDSKNGRPHIVMLSNFARLQFEALRKLVEDMAGKTGKDVSAWVMPARLKSGSVCPRSIAKQVADRQRGENAPMAHRSPLTSALVLQGGKWTPHDLRRTGATIMASLNVRPDVIERCLNHADENRVRRTYNRHSYAQEMAEAWRLLGERLELLTGQADNVITLHKAA